MSAYLSNKPSKWKECKLNSRAKGTFYKPDRKIHMYKCYIYIYTQLNMYIYLYVYEIIINWPFRLKGRWLVRAECPLEHQKEWHQSSSPQHFESNFGRKGTATCFESLLHCQALQISVKWLGSQSWGILFFPSITIIFTCLYKMYAYSKVIPFKIVDNPPHFHIKLSRQK